MAKVSDDMLEKLAEARKDKSRRCGITLADGGNCGNWAGAGTDHKGSGPCWAHDPNYIGRGVKKARGERIQEARAIDVASVAVKSTDDPAVLELAGEIRRTRAILDSVNSQLELNGDQISDPELIRSYALLVDNLRKLALAKDKIERERRYLIPAKVAVSMAQAVMRVVIKYLPQEQRYAIMAEVKQAMTVEMALDNQNKWVDPQAEWASRQMETPAII